MTLFRKDDALHVPAVAKEVYDVSGAGDTVIATLGVMLAAGLDLATRCAGPTRRPASSSASSARPWCIQTSCSRDSHAPNS